jgi:predicted Fe-Mo cluster-binding NifX family protein
MKLFIPTQSDSEKSLVSEQLGRANYFYVYDTDKNEGQFYKNSFSNENHGAGVKTAEFILKQGSYALLTPRVGEKALDILLNTDVKMYKSNGKVVKEVIQDFIDQKLEELY